MISKSFTVTSPGGLHARPAANLVSLAKSFGSQLTITCDNQTAPLKNPIKLLALGVAKGSVVTIAADGDDEMQAIERITQFFEEELHTL